MKKRLLITSIVMMLVVAVALSTATYAWFTSSATVTSSSISMTAATNTAASLGISWDNITYGTSITADDPQSGALFNPACPATLNVAGAAGTTTLSTVAFTTAAATPSNGDMKFKNNGTATQVYTWTNDTSADPEGNVYTSFFIKNLSPSSPISSLTLTAEFGNNGGESLLRVGVFKKNTVTDHYELLGVLAKQAPKTYTVVDTDAVMDGETTYYKLYLGKYTAAIKGANIDAVNNGTADWYPGMEAPAGKFFTEADTATAAKAVYGDITGGASVNAMATIDCVTSISLAGSGEGQQFTAGSVMEFVVLVWEDAVALGDLEGGSVASIGLKFEA